MNDAMDRAGLWVVQIGAALVAALHVVAVVVSGRQTLGTEPLEVTGMPIGNAQTPEFSEPFTAITEARYESVAITLEGAPSSARWLVWGADAVSSFAVIGICLALLWLCARLRNRRPFGRSITAALLTTSVLVMVGGTLSQLLDAFGHAEVVRHLGLESTAGDHGNGAVEGFPAFALDLSLSPIGIGLAIGVVAAAFEVGARMQRDTEGLV